MPQLRCSHCARVHWQITSLGLAGSPPILGPALRIGLTAAAAAGGTLLVTLGGAPAGAAAAAWRVRIGSADATIASSTADANKRSVALILLAPPPPKPASLLGLVVLPDSAGGGDDNCSAACCADGAACAVVGACGAGTRFTCFSVEYWDDAAPYIVSASPLSG